MLRNQVRVATIASFVLLGAVIAVIGFNLSAAASPQLQTSPSSPAIDEQAAPQIANLVEQNPQFIAAENGLVYSYASNAKFSQVYSNGTNSQQASLLYFDHYAAIPPNSSANCTPIVLSQLQVTASQSGPIQAIHLVMAGLNTNHGPPTLTQWC
jgi:hypothetical protein